MIVRTRQGQNVELHSFALTDMVRWGYTGLRNLRPSIGDAEIRGIPAISRAVRLRSEAVASLGLYCWRGRGPGRDRVETVWQARLFAKRPNPQQTRFGFWETAEESLCYRGNAYLWKNVDTKTGRVVEWWALHPDQVEVRDVNGRVVYRVQVAAGYVDPTGQGAGIYDVDESTILHIRGHGQGGQIVAPSPIEVFRDALAGPIGRQRHEGRMWRRGTAVQMGIEFPLGVTTDQASQWREVWRSNMEGTEGETTAVVGGGGKLQKIGLTPADAQFVEMADLTVQDASRIIGVPANLLGATGAGGKQSRVDLEQELMTWLRFGLGPGLERIEDALFSDDILFGSAALLAADARGSLGLYPGFDTDGFVRGDLLTEATILQGFVQSGVLLPNEARRQLGYEDHPDGNVLQITPVGGAPNPLANPKTGGNTNAQGDDAQTARDLGIVQGRLDVLASLATQPAPPPTTAPSLDPELVAALSAMTAAVTARREADPELVAVLAQLAARSEDAATDPILLAVLVELADALRRDQPTDPVLIAALHKLAADRRPRTAVATRLDDGTVRVDYQED